MKKLFQNRRTLYFLLCIMMVFIFTLTMAYAALSTVLKITGNAEVLSASWDIHLDNVQVKNGSVEADTPVITNNSTLTFDVDLNKPGDYYEFSVDVVNDGTIDAMIDSVVKSPELTSEQAKYVLYEVSYANGESVSTKQTLRKQTSTPIKVRVAYRKDLNASDLPTSNDKLSLSLTLLYVQSNDTGSVIPNNGVSVVNVVSGNGTQVGDEICIDTECFYVISSTDEDVTMLSKYNLLVGNRYDGTNGAVPLENPTGIQDITAIGWFSNFTVNNPMIGITTFSSTNYWSSLVSGYPAYVYGEDSYLYEYVENYKEHLEGLGASINEARLITKKELEVLGCSSGICSGAPSWVYSTSYWTAEAADSSIIWVVSSGNYFSNNYYTSNNYGVRPVIIISKSLI